MDLGILNTVIAMVIVLLVLSLLVQAVQMLLKKLLKLKSKQIEDSLKDLYDQAIGGGPPSTQQAANANNPAANASSTALVHASANGAVARIGHLARVAIVGSSDTASAGAEVFTRKVLEEFKKIGRVTKYGKPVLDSLSKEDLFKVIAKFEAHDFFPDYAEKFKQVCNQIIELREAVETISSQLRGPASSKLAQIRVVMAPIFNNVEAILDGEQVKPNVLFADLLRLRQLDIGGVLNLLDEAQEAITQERIAAKQANNTEEFALLNAISEQLAAIAGLIGDLSKRFDEAVSPLRGKLEQVEVWFDTVTQSFDERYARHMKTVSIYVSIVIVILLNANFFRIYTNLSANEVQRNLISEAGAGILDRNKQAAASQASFAVPTPTPSLNEEIEQSRQVMQGLVDTYEGFGFSPLTGEQFYTFLWSTGGWTALAKDPYGNRGWLGFRPAKNDKGLIVNVDNIPIPPNCQDKDIHGNAILREGKLMKCEPAWVGQSGSEWWQSRKDDVFTLFGWAVMVMLLSVGAPFWQDTLESLFGIKNLLRQKSGTQNIETQSGAGQPKQA